MVVDTLLSARWIVPVDPGGIYEHHTLALANGQIADLLPTEQACQRYPNVDTLDFTRHVLIPGLINTHTHAAMTLMRGLADDLPLMVWLQQHIWPTEQRWVDPRFVRDGTDLAMIEMLRGGITCFSDMYFFPDTVIEAVEAVGMRAVAGLIVLDFPTAWGSGADDYLTKGIALAERLQDHSLIKAAWAPHAPYTVSKEPLQRIRDLAAQWQLPVHMHVHETADEVTGHAEQHGQRPLAYLDDLGLLSPALNAVHMTQLTDAEIDRLAATGANVLHCPESNLKLASGFCPVARLDAAGVNVAIGTDGAASNNDLDLFSEMRTTALLGKALSGDAAALPAERILAMATLNGAKALGLADRTGSLTVGKSADIVAVDLAAPETEPVYNPISQLVYAAGRHQVSDVWVAGRRLLDNRRLTTIDDTAVRQRAIDWQQRIAKGND